jgi:hypothetical protein
LYISSGTALINSGRGIGSYHKVFVPVRDEVRKNWYLIIVSVAEKCLSVYGRISDRRTKQVVDTFLKVKSVKLIWMKMLNHVSILARM